MSMFRSRRRLPIILAVVTALLLMATLAGCGTSSSSTSSSGTSSAPSQITVGVLYAKSGSFASSSLPEYQGLQFWANQVNAQGGVLVKAYNKRIPVKIIGLNDDSDAATAGTLYNQLITQDKVNILVADFGSVLTAPAVTVAQEHKVVLFDPTGTGASFFTASNPYIVLTSLPSSGWWPTSLANFLLDRKIDKIAVVYGENDFDSSQAETLQKMLAGGGVKPVYYQGVPTSTSNYAVILRNIAAQKPDAVIEFGYNTNDIAFLQGIRSGGYKFNMVFTVFPGQQYALIEKSVGVPGLEYTYSYPTPPLFGYNQVNYGLGMNAFVQAFAKADNVKPADVNFLDIAGYNCGLVIQKALENAPSLKQEDLRAAVAGFSDKLDTLDGHFKIDSTGAQLGETLPVCQFQPAAGGTLKPVIVYPPSLAQGKAIYPAP